MRIKSLKLQDYRGFASCELSLDRPLTVLVGVNGSGKSSVLSACKLALSGMFVDAYHYEEVPWHEIAEDTDVRRGAKELSVVATLANGDVTRETGCHYRKGAEKRASAFGDSGLLGLHDAAPALAVAYGASRNVATTAEAFAPLDNKSGAPKEDPTSAIHDALVAGTLKFKSLFQWFKAREDIENELKVARQDLSLEDPQLGAVRRAIAGMLPGFSGLRVQRDPLHMVIRKGDEVLVIDQLSDGEKLLLALTADLARRLAMTYADRGDPLQGEAVVLIDEIELHLHPSWQRRVLGALRRTFPNCQFIVTTHSPQVLSEVPNDAVMLLQDFQVVRPAAPTAGRDSNAILWEVLGVEAHPHEVVTEIDAIAGLLDDGKLGEARERLDRLAETLTERDPEVVRLRGLLDVVERMDAGDHQGA